MVLGYDHWTPQEQTRVADRLRELYGSDFIGKAMHEIRTNGHKSDLMDVMLVSVKSDERAGWVQSAVNFLREWGKALYARMAAIVERMRDSWASLVIANQVPQFIVGLYNRCGDLLSATGKKLTRTAQYIWANVRQLWTYIIDTVYRGKSMSQEEKDAIDEGAEQAGWIRSAVKSLASWAGTFVSIISNGIMAVCRAVMSVLGEAVNIMAEGATALFDQVLKFPEYASKLVNDAHRAVVQSFLLMMNSLLEIRIMINGARKDLQQRWRFAINAINKQVEKVAKAIKRMAADSTVTQVMWIGMLNTPFLGGIIKALGLDINDTYAVVLFLVQRVYWVIKVINSIWARGAEALFAYLRGLLPSATDIAQRIFPNAVKMIKDGLAGPFSTVELDESIKAAQKLGEKADQIDPVPRRRLRRAADLAERYQRLLSEYTDDIRAKTYSKSPSTAWRGATLAAEIQTRGYFNEGVDEEQLDELCQIRYGMPWRTMLFVSSSITINLKVQIVAANVNAAAVKQRERDARPFDIVLEEKIVDAALEAKTVSEFADHIVGDQKTLEARLFGVIPLPFETEQSLKEALEDFHPSLDTSRMETVNGLNALERQLKLLIAREQQEARQAYDLWDNVSGPDDSLHEVIMNAGAFIGQMRRFRGERLAQEVITKMERAKIAAGALEKRGSQLRRNTWGLRMFLTIGAVVASGFLTWWMYSWFTDTSVVDNKRAREMEKAHDGSMRTERGRLAQMWRKDYENLLGRKVNWQDSREVDELLAYERVQEIHLQTCNIEGIAAGSPQVFEDWEQKQKEFFPDRLPGIGDGKAGTAGPAPSLPSARTEVATVTVEKSESTKALDEQLEVYLADNANRITSTTQMMISKYGSIMESANLKSAAFNPDDLLTTSTKEATVGGIKRVQRNTGALWWKKNEVSYEISNDFRGPRDLTEEALRTRNPRALQVGVAIDKRNELVEAVSRGRQRIVDDIVALERSRQPGFYEKAIKSMWTMWGGISGAVTVDASDGIQEAARKFSGDLASDASWGGTQLMQTIILSLTGLLTTFAIFSFWVLFFAWAILLISNFLLGDWEDNGMGDASYIRWVTKTLFNILNSFIWLSKHVAPLLTFLISTFQASRFNLASNWFKAAAVLAGPIGSGAYVAYKMYAVVKGRTVPTSPRGSVIRNNDREAARVAEQADRDARRAGGIIDRARDAPVTTTYTPSPPQPTTQRPPAFTSAFGGPGVTFQTGL